MSNSSFDSCTQTTSQPKRTVVSEQSVTDTPRSRPDDCECLTSYTTEHPLPCWVCHLEGFDIPNPTPPTEGMNTEETTETKTDAGCDTPHSVEESIPTNITSFVSD